MDIHIYIYTGYLLICRSNMYSNTILAHIIKLAAASSYHWPFLYWLWEVQPVSPGFPHVHGLIQFLNLRWFFLGQAKTFQASEHSTNEPVEWPFSIAMLVYQRVQSVHALNFWGHSHSLSHLSSMHQPWNSHPFIIQSSPSPCAWSI